MKTALLTLNIGNVLRENSRASFIAAARRWGCDYIEITESSEPFPHAMKLRAFELCDADRIFYIDSDTVISADCPSPFDVFPEDAFVACENQQEQMTELCRNACADNIARDLLTINEVMGVNLPNYPTNFINSGMWVASRALHSDVLKYALKVALACHGRTAWMDQSALNHALISARTPVYKPAPTWNYQFPPDSGSGPMENFIYHWAGGENRDQIDGVNWRSFRAAKVEQAFRKRKLLWVGDIVCHTGFARVTENILSGLRENWDIKVVGINYPGDPHDLPYPIWPARNGGDIWGIGECAAVIDRERPDAICILQDPWIVSRFATEINRGPIPMAAYMPVDANNQNPDVCQRLNNLDLAIFYTRFGEVECRMAGYKGESAIIPHGVNTEIYRPICKKEARSRMEVDNLPENAFIFGNVNRNSPRKRLDLSIEAFARWLRQRAGAADRIEDAYLYLHCSNHDTAGIYAMQLANYWGVSRRLIMPDQRLVTPYEGLPEHQMPLVYSSFDVQISTTLGEGWGLSQIEGAACSIPQIVPQFAALGEWMAAAAWQVPCSGRVTHPVINTIGAVPDVGEMVRALDLFYRRPDVREKYSQLALACAQKPEFRWQNIAERFDTELTRMVVNARARELKRETEQKEKEANGEVPETKPVSQAV
jgi:D-inositol-3-phosphate glycosyltransferase